ncbi:alpha/beta fold hydrolase [Cellulomonas denverensis]|uniref:alpha/beta fold hydrolase n=1 Tax=Cellulomonas denverensis TaxID=264297 RepID=UPI0035EC2EB8
MPTLSRPRADLDYSVRRTGDGPVVVTAHGLTSSRAMAAAEGLFDWSALGAGGTLVEYDARGHGGSTGAPVPADYTWSAQAGDLLALIDQVSPDAPVDAVGASMGTATVLWAAALRPDRFRRLVLTIPPTAWDTRAAQADTYQADARSVEQHGLGPWVRAAAATPRPGGAGRTGLRPGALGARRRAAQRAARRRGQRPARPRRARPSPAPRAAAALDHRPRSPGLHRRCTGPDPARRAAGGGGGPHRDPRLGGARGGVPGLTGQRGSEGLSRLTTPD